jgi:hypothetical protein
VGTAATEQEQEVAVDRRWGRSPAGHHRHRWVCRLQVEYRSAEPDQLEQEQLIRSGRSPLDHREDVTIASCATDQTVNAPAAKVTVKNSSSKPSDYFVTIAFESPDGKTQYDTAIAAFNSLGPGQTASDTATSTKSGVPAGFGCKVVDAIRTSAVG